MESVRWAFRCGSWSPSCSEWLLAARCVQREEKDRIGQFVFAKDSKSAMAGRLLIRKLITEKMNIPWNEIHLERTPKGKPVLAKPVLHNISQKYNFNISHQGDYVVLAAEPGFQVGVDVMKTSRPVLHWKPVLLQKLVKKLTECVNLTKTVIWLCSISSLARQGSTTTVDFFKIMKRQFTDHEWKVIKSAGSELKQLDMFYRHWTLKESFIKAIGTGVSFNLQRIEFHLSTKQMNVEEVKKDTKLLLDGEQEDNWVFEECMLDSNHHVAVALGMQDKVNQESCSAFSDPNPARFITLNFNDLVTSAIPLTEEDYEYWEHFQKKSESPSRQHTLVRD
ncbi:L-aminoadipate-semialdehyde dehydrogenase-phosphopantetheinyl transferase isoform X2 [Polypterus senegalus]|uniref:L-aminoadipate-semialdehyde dehydrogenase-phosphopantetheinyl transferase isoform X2 n=1 Tax=Polypterus senegalus TaxID=55291 RepID=UPI0019661EC4|nr:L-aminoadipate-semialdehyde dehydrogenase-phosphopantetheinyl transferase isoform X2 [Polypterus senegalus]